VEIDLGVGAEEEAAGAEVDGVELDALAASAPGHLEVTAGAEATAALEAHAGG
jgi:hypothetical protein